MYIKLETVTNMYVLSVVMRFSAVYLRSLTRFPTYIGCKLQIIDRVSQYYTPIFYRTVSRHQSK